MEIIAHRGASHDAPENTLAAARLAWAQGADALECDVQLTRDGRLAVIHDGDTQRVAGVARQVAELTLAELQELDVGRWKKLGYAGEKIPSLDQLLAAVPAGKRIFIEVKDGPEAVGELVRCLARCALQPAQVVIISFHLETARQAKRALPRCETCWVRDRAARGDALGATASIDPVIAAGCAAELDGLDLDATWPVDVALAQRVRDAGLKLYVWTVDDADQARDLAAARIDGLATNRPGWMRDQLGSASD